VCFDTCVSSSLSILVAFVLVVLVRVMRNFGPQSVLGLFGVWHCDMRCCPPEGCCTSSFFRMTFLVVLLFIRSLSYFTPNHH
jgi:hypothetical protein